MTNNLILVDPKQYFKMKFISNALEYGWTVKPKNNKLVFMRKHEGKVEVMEDEYLERFIKQNLTPDMANIDLKVILS